MAEKNIGLTWSCLDFKKKKSPAFIHIPKTGGTYLMQLESGGQGVLNGVRSFGHSYVIDDKRELNPVYLSHNPAQAQEAVVDRRTVNKYYIFSTVRNIFSWLVSYAGHAGGWNPQYATTRHYDHANVAKGFDYLIETIANREDQWPNRKLIHCQLFSSGTDLIVDHINHQESLDNDLAVLARRLGVTYEKKPAQRLGQHKDYREYYTDKLIDLVATTWNRELQLFGYDINGRRLDNAVLKTSIDAGVKSRIKYCWKKDQLMVGDQELVRA